jgi:hypothetical protein
MDSAVMRGVDKINCPIIIAAGVNKSPSTPNGPCLEIKENTNNPTTTVGIAISVSNKVITALLPLNSLITITKLRGSATSDANRTAIDDTLRDTRVQLITSLSKVKMSFRAVENPSQRYCNYTPM